MKQVRVFREFKASTLIRHIVVKVFAEDIRPNDIVLRFYISPSWILS